MFLDIRKMGDPILIQPTKPVTEFHNRLCDLAETMVNIMYDNEGVGLAANQIGFSQSIFVYDDQEGHSGIICNPELTYIGEESENIKEGCLSIPGQHYETSRYKKVKLVGQDIVGSTIQLEADNLLARIFQHETDHLNGKLYISKLSKAIQAGIILGRQAML